MPQNFTTNLAVSKGGTIIHNVQSITFSGGGVTLTQDPANPRGVDVTIAGGGTYTPQWQAGTVTDLGSNLSLNDGTLDATGGGSVSFADGLGISFDTVSNPGTVTANNTGTIALPTVSGTASGQGIYLSGGRANGSGAGGGVSGQGGYSYSGHGGSAFWGGGNSYYGQAGALTAQGGDTFYGYGGQSQFYSGASSTFPGASNLVGAGYSKFAPGGEIEFGLYKRGGSTPDTGFPFGFAQWVAGENPDGKVIFTASRPCRVKAIIFRQGAANVAASTATVVKCASGVAPGSGVAMASDSMDATGSPNTNTSLTLSAATAASSDLTFSGQPNDGESVTIGNNFFRYIFRNSPSSRFDVQIGADATASLSNLVDAVNAQPPPTSGGSFFVSGAMGVGASATFTAKFAGARANAISTITTVTGASWSGATLGDGTPGTSDLDMVAGDSLIIVTSGGSNWATSAGCCTVFAAPQ